MKSPGRGKKQVLERLIPAHLIYLFKDSPVRWFENARAYDHLIAENLAEYQPQSLIEYHWIKDLTDTQWELRLLRRLKKAALQAETPTMAVKHLGPRYKEMAPKMDLKGDEESLTLLVRTAARGNAWSKSKIDAVMDDWASSYEMLAYKAYEAGLPAINALDAKIDKAERRRDDLTLKFLERRQMLASMTKSLIEKAPPGDIIEVAPEETEAKDKT